MTKAVARNERLSQEGYLQMFALFWKGFITEIFWLFSIFIKNNIFVIERFFFFAFHEIFS